MTDIMPGSFGLSVIGGKLGWWIDKGQAFVEQQDYKFTHAFLVLDDETVIEAQPGGARITPLSVYTSRPEGTVIFTDEPVQRELDAYYTRKRGWNAGADLHEFEARLREKLVDFGRSLNGTPYNYIDYLAIALDRFGFRPRLIRKRMQRHDRLICSQLVDYVYTMAGIHLFDDGRDPFDVTPGDLEGWIRTYG